MCSLPVCLCRELENATPNAVQDVDVKFSPILLIHACCIDLKSYPALAVAMSKLQGAIPQVGGCLGPMAESDDFDIQRQLDSQTLQLRRPARLHRFRERSQ